MIHGTLSSSQCSPCHKKIITKKFQSITKFIRSQYHVVLVTSMHYVNWVVFLERAFTRTFQIVHFSRNTPLVTFIILLGLTPSICNSVVSTRSSTTQLHSNGSHDLQFPALGSPRCLHELNKYTSLLACKCLQDFSFALSRYISK